MNEEGLFKQLTIRGIISETKDFKTFMFEENTIHYKPGQYLTLVDENDTEIRRSYSIISSLVLSEPLSIGIKRVVNGFFSRKLIDHARPGDKILTIGSGGFFVLPDNIKDYNHLFFFAAGSGITPILSLLNTSLHSYKHLYVTLVYSNGAESKAAFLQVLKELENAFRPRFRLHLLFSNNADLTRARLHRDLILELIASLQQVGSTLFYICGPESYMRLCTYTLQEAGITAANIKKENFIVHNVAKRDALPPDAHDHYVRIKLNDKEFTVLVNYPDSILKASKKAGFILPYSCEAGRCGSCVAKCLDGNVWHSYNEVLTDGELSKGLVLTCVGHPIGGDVELQI